MKYFILSIAIMAALWIGLYAQEKQEKKPTIKELSEAILKSSSEKERLEIIKQFDKDLTALQRQLVEGLEAAKEKEKKIAFVFLIGHYRLKHTVRVLAKIIDLESEVPLVRFSAEPLWDQYPVVEALINIGRPAIPAMLENIKAAKGEKITKLSVDVIQYIETPTIAKMILQDVIAKQKDPTKITNLRESLKHLKE